MIDIKPVILSALENDAKIVEQLGGLNIYQLTTPKQYPSITFFEYDNIDSNYADDEATASRFYIQIDVWDKRPRDDIAIEVNRVMKSLGFSRASSIDLFEADTAICHKAMRFKATKLI